MKIRKCKVRVLSNASASESFEDFSARFKKLWQLAESKKSSSKEHEFVITIPDASWLAKIFSLERVRIIQTVKHKQPGSITELAKILGREKTNVHRDVSALADLGILELTKVKNAGKSEVVKPEYNWDEFDLAV